MTPLIPEYLLAIDSTLRSLVAAIALGLIWVGAGRVAAPEPARYRTAGVLSAVFIAWFALAQYLGSANAYFSASDAAVPTVMFGLLIPLIVAGLAIWRSGRVASLVAAIPLHWLVAAQVFRVGGGIFLVLWASSKLPWQFALPAGIGDVATGLLAVPVAMRLARKEAGAHRAAYAWNLFGVADLVVALAMGAMTSPGRVHLLAVDAPNLLITSYPLVMIPTFAVPVALILHGLVFWLLGREDAVHGRFAVA